MISNYATGLFIVCGSEKVDLIDNENPVFNIKGIKNQA
jgi:hypothetical protein